jgi:hypothetical protein
MIKVLNIDIRELINNNEFVCITTNGYVKKNGECVMGRGVAKIAAELYPEMPKRIGIGIKEFGNQVYWFRNLNIFTFPVKHNWWEKADINLIVKSTKELSKYVDKLHIEKCYLPKPGCENGRLKWEDVEREIEPFLHSNVIIIDKP